MAFARINSIVEYFGVQEDRHCGYCKNDDPSRYSYGMWAHKMTVQAYQDIIDRGWRRSGKYCYKPNMKKTCCPQYTIRCDALEFRPSRAQKRVIRRLNGFLASGILPKTSSYEIDVDHPKKNVDADEIQALQKKEAAVEPPACEHPVISGASGGGGTSAKPKDRQRKAKFRRRQRKLEKLRATGVQIDALPPRPPMQPKPLEDLLSFSASSPTNCLKIVGAAHSLEIRLVQSCPASEEFTETFKTSFELYERYQEIIHNDPSNESGFRRFLVDSPLQPVAEVSHVQNQQDRHPGYGSFHQQYWLDGTKLIAVGVLDILPNCVSSKYFYYDPDFRPLALGVYSALQEIALVRRLQKYSPSLRYYYMGFYIHNCPKMRYKGRYRPSSLLCPEACTWHSIEKCQEKLDATSYCRFDESGAVDVDSNVDLTDVPVLFGGKLTPYPVYKMRKYGRRSGDENDEEEVTEFASLVGRKAAPCLILYRSDED